MNANEHLQRGPGDLPLFRNELADKVCMVFGGGSVAPGWSIGRALCISYARSGANVVVCDRNAQSAEDTANLIRRDGGRAIPVEVDAVDEGSVARAVDLANAEYGKIDVLHNNVGIGKAGNSSNTSADEWRRISDANLTSLHIATQAVIPFMKLTGGVILTTSTIGSLRYLGFPHLAYNSTKAAANHFSRLIAAEYACYGIRANTLIAGLMDTPRIRFTLKSSAYQGSEDEMMRQRNRQVPLGFMGDAWDVALAAVFLASDKARYISGAELLIDGALAATVRTND